MNEDIFIYRNCPLCRSKNSKVKFTRNYKTEEIKEELFSARRERKKKTYEHNTFLKCKDCGLIYASPIINPIVVEKLYKKSKYNYSIQESNLKETYGRALKKTEKYIKNKERVLDIGTGNGFFLLEAIDQGYKEAYGIEPSKHAASLADKKIYKNIIQDILRPNQFKKNFFDIITLFQVIDHIEEPNQVLKICNDYLKENGVILIISHNVNSISSKILGEKSPIFDIEHTQLFDKKTITKILNKNGFKVVNIFSVTNTYTLDYWITMSPLPKHTKNILKKLLPQKILNKKVTIKPGNFGVVGIKR